MKNIQKKAAVNSAVEWIDDMIRTYESGIRDLKNHRRRLIEVSESPDPATTPTQVISWVVNETQNVQRNLRLDMAVTHATYILQAERLR